MLLSKVTKSRPVKLFTVYAAWLGFSSIVLVLTNAFASLDKIRSYQLRTPDVLLTFAFIILWGILEAMGAGILLVLVELSIEKVLKKRLDLVFRLIVAASLLLSLLILLLTIFRIL